MGKPIHSKWQLRLIRALLAGAVLLALYQLFILPFLTQWGSTQNEFAGTRPGDSLVRRPDYKNTLAVTVNAAPDRVWPWIAQMGRDRAGFYSYGWLQKTFGCATGDAREIHPEWQFPVVGQPERGCGPGLRRHAEGWEVAVVERGRALVWKSRKGAWILAIYLDSSGPGQSRLLTRMEYTQSPRNTLDWMLEKAWLAWAQCIMQRGMIQGIRRRAENR